MILNFFSLIFMIWKIERAEKEGKGTFRELFLHEIESSQQILPQGV